MSAKDVRNIWERIFSYFERLLTGKTKKGDWVILLILLGVIFILASRYGGPVGGFTFVLAVATIWNVKITQGLLRRSEETSRQSKASFENDVFRRVVFSISQLEAQLKISGESSYKKRCIDLALAMLGAIKISDASTYKRVKEVMKEVWPRSEQGLPIECIEEALKKLDGENTDKTKRPRE